MSKLSPLQSVKKQFGSKEQLLGKVAELISGNDGESREDFIKRIKYVANAKLLRLLAVGEKVKELGGRAALATKIAEFKKQAKDKDFASKLAALPLPRLLDLFQSLDRKAKSAKPAKAAPVKAEDKAAPVKDAKAAKPAAKK